MRTRSVLAASLLILAVGACGNNGAQLNASDDDDDVHGEDHGDHGSDDSDDHGDDHDDHGGHGGDDHGDDDRTAS